MVLPFYRYCILKIMRNLLPVVRILVLDILQIEVRPRLGVKSAGVVTQSYKLNFKRVFEIKTLAS